MIKAVTDIGILFTPIAEADGNNEIKVVHKKYHIPVKLGEGGVKGLLTEACHRVN
jgi:hypothetical protein